VILELLRREGDWLRSISAALRFAYYVSCLGAAGLCIFALGFRRLQEPRDAAVCRRMTLATVAVGLASSLVWLTVQVALASAGDPFDAEVWDLMLTSRPGLSVLVVWVGLLAVALAAWIGPAVIAVGAAGILVIAASFTTIGHTSQHEQRWLLGAILILHLLAVAFWVGSLWPLALASRRGGPSAVRLLKAWTRAAGWVVAALLLAGVVLASLLVERLELLVTTAYGLALLAKVALVGVLLAFAARHRFRLTPALVVNAPGSGARLAASIGCEAIVMALVFWAVAELTSASPNGEG
jgi:putative copper export protein